MSSFDRRWILSAALFSAVAACGFTPTHQKGGGGQVLFGQVVLPEATDPNEFTFRERLRRRFGAPRADAQYRLDSEISLTETELAITQASDVTRYRITATVSWRLVAPGDNTVAYSGEVSTFTGFDATDSALAARAARQAAEKRAVTELAELTAARLAAMVNESGGA